MWKTAVEGRGSVVHRASRQPDLLIGSRDEPRGCRLSGGPGRLLTARSVTHLPLSLREAAAEAGSAPTTPVMVDGAVRMDVGAIKGHSSARGEAGLSLTPGRPSPWSP